MTASTTAAKPVFRKVTQIGLVVKDVEATARLYWEHLGIGPWKIYSIDPSNTPNMTLRGKPVAHAFRAALTTIGDIGFELIEPLHGDSLYAEHLSKHGEGLHHLAFQVDSFDEAKAQLARQGYGEVQSGHPFGVCAYTYVDMQEALGCLAELGSGVREGLRFPEPHATIP